jgi:hypothetical protein
MKNLVLAKIPNGPQLSTEYTCVQETAGWPHLFNKVHRVQLTTFFNKVST